MLKANSNEKRADYHSHTQKSTEMDVTINVGGTLFITETSTLAKVSNTKLSNLCAEDESYNSLTNVYQFDRNPVLFHNILDCYRTGEFHIPPTTCIGAAKKELEFWNIPEYYIASCCLNKFHEYKWKEKMTNDFYDNMFSNFDELQKLIKGSSGFKQLLLNIWMHLEYPYFSKLAKVRLQPNSVMIFNYDE